MDATYNACMTSQIDRVAFELAERVLTGRLKAGERVLEVPFSKELGVSRTPLRLALGELEKQGLLERLPTRGYRVRSFTIDEVAKALEVRGTLEGMAARLIAEAGPAPETLRKLRLCIDKGRAVIEHAHALSEAVDTIAWAAMNAEFHDILTSSAGNPALASALAHVGRTPMVKPGELWAHQFDSVVSFNFFRRAQLDHEEVVNAIQAREGARVEYLMREHARRSADNKRTLASQMPKSILASSATF